MSPQAATLRPDQRRIARIQALQSAFPDDLRDEAQFVMLDDPGRTPMTLHQAILAYMEGNAPGNGIGLTLTPGSNLRVVQIEACIDALGVVLPAVDALLDGSRTYAERAADGRGIVIIGRSSLAPAFAPNRYGNGVHLRVLADGIVPITGDALDGVRETRPLGTDFSRIVSIDTGHGEATVCNWPEPTPLPDALPPVQPFDAELLPETLRAWVLDIAHRMQCPPDFSAVGAIVAASSLIGARAVVQPKARDDWQVVPNLWGLAVGRPGIKKSPALSEVLKPLHRLEAEESERWQAEHDAWEIDGKLVKLQAADREKKAQTLATKDPAAARALLEPMGDAAEPVSRRFIVNDATVEKLGELLKVNPWGVLSYRDEMHGLLTSLDKPGQEGSRAFYLQGYDGNQGYTFDRIQRGTVRLPRVCFAMLGGIQPGRVQQYVRSAVEGGSGDDGLLQRFGLTVWPDVVGDFVDVDRWPDTAARQAAWSVYERLACLQPASDADPAVWRFTPDAQAVFTQWCIPFEQELRRGDLHPAVESHLAKYRKLIPALALIFALVDRPDAGVIGARELIRALAWGDYLRSHAERLYGAATRPEMSAAANLLKRIRAGALGCSFTPREASQKGWTGLASPDAVRKAADVLEEYDWLRLDVMGSGATGGRPSERYSVNPFAWGGTA